MKTVAQSIVWFIKIAAGSVLFALGFNLFLLPNELNAGGISGLAMIAVHVLDFGSVGMITMLVNLPLFAVGGIKIGKKFFFGSLAGMIASSVALDALAGLPYPAVDPLLAALYGGAMCGLGLGLVFSLGASTGGSDIIVRLLKRKMQNVPIGTINICFDLAVAALTGMTFRNISSALYSGVAIFITGKVIDAVVYSFDYSKVVVIISDYHEQIVRVITEDLDRGVTYLHGEGAYSNSSKKVIFSVVKKQQIAELKRFVVKIDPNAFIVVQDAHQVLGEGFGRYSKDSL